MDFGSIIRESRLQAGLTQAELADRSGTSQAAVSAYECGAKVPAADTLERILRACGARLTTTPGLVEASADEDQSPSGASTQRGRALWDLLLLADAIGRPPRANRPRFPVLKTE
ncbi:MAG: helix-turn-helix domain-containing protein [Solirubrobacterales bacterium]